MVQLNKKNGRRSSECATSLIATAVLSLLTRLQLQDHLKYVVTLVEDLQQYQLSRAVELASLENFVPCLFMSPRVRL